MSEEGKPKKNYKKNFKSNNRNNKKPNNRPNNRKFSGSKGKSRRPKTLTPARVIQKYQNLLEQYLIARKKFFEIFGRGKEKQIDKVEKNYKTALANLRNFEKNLIPWQKEVLDKKYNGLPEDRQYSTDNNLSPEGDTVSIIEEPSTIHTLESQANADYSNDTEESSGSMEDYYAYKGITPPAIVDENQADKKRRQ